MFLNSRNVSFVYASNYIVNFLHLTNTGIRHGRLPIFLSFYPHPDRSLVDPGVSTHPPSFRRLWLPILIGAGWLATCYFLIVVFKQGDRPGFSFTATAAPLALVVAVTGTLDMNGQDQSIDELTGAGSVLTGGGALLGDLDLAFEYLERGYETEPGTLAGVGADPSVDPLRGDPRWQALAELARGGPEN